MAEVVEFLYGPRDGDVWPDGVPLPDSLPVLVGTSVVGENGRTLIGRYLPATRIVFDSRDARWPATPEPHIRLSRRALIFQGWFLNQPGDTYGPQTGGTVGLG